MLTTPTAKDIKARRTVRFAAGHLAQHTDWTGTVVGYSALYDTVHVYVDAPGNSESGSKITYSRKDVEWCEPTPAVVEHRETTIRVAGVDRVIRTERTGKVRTVAQLEAAHTKAVKAHLAELEKAGAEQRHADAIASIHAGLWEDKEGFPGSGKRLYERAVSEEEIRHMTRKPREFTPVKTAYTDARKGWPKVPSKPAPVPSYMAEIESGHWVTPEVAESLKAKEVTPEVLPGLVLVRYTDKSWTLNHTASADEEHPHGRSLGPVFKSTARARQVAAEELAGFDWTRPADALTSDPETVAVVTLIKWREFAAKSVRNAWAMDHVEEAEATLAALRAPVLVAA
ncbi:hypothetical protein [Streptomyces chryseus]|uniref:hypothetical protein n=1 Tax=Streptomyces chryseus TaxID=68186 RepID=UPI00110FF6AB|nr:hypothetical protein [Streptomyces chryseus]GGX26587.1 hypothetical protein GCM10010353_47040 [Streptomyces chryseus]